MKNMRVPVKVFLIIIPVVFFTGCNGSKNSESVFNADLINRHLDTEVTFSEKYRPQFHYTPRINWMNDPNGLVYYEGKYHLFHQYNPFGNRWGYMSWNHAVSDDLVHWEHLPVAIEYGKEQEEAIFSGSAVVDHNNTSGFGNGKRAPLVAIYTSHYTREDGSTWQAQSLAYSIDGGGTFEKYANNPVLKFDDPDFRDPNVKWMDDMEKWVMVVALPRQHKVQFYASANLTEWEYLSDFGPAGAVGGIWECPDMFPLALDDNPGDIRWILHVDLSPGAVAGGSGSQFFVGHWDGVRFIPDEKISDGQIIWADYGTDFYAAITWNDIPEEDGRRLWVGWMNNWMYANDIPTHPWRSAQSIPRSLHLTTIEGEIRIVQRPVEELKVLRKGHAGLRELKIANGVTSLAEHGIEGKAYELIVVLEPSGPGTTGLKLRGGDQEESIVGYDAGSRTVFVDRTNSGENNFHQHFARRNDAPARLTDGRIKLHIFVDWSSIEVFVNDGETVITKRIFPSPESQDISVFADGDEAVLTQLDFWPLKSIWNDQPAGLPDISPKK
jgi:fructan beta-fructosidase